MQEMKEAVYLSGKKMTIKQKKFADEYIIRQRVCGKCHSLQHPEMSEKMFRR